MSQPDLRPEPLAAARKPEGPPQVVLAHTKQSSQDAKAETQSTTVPQVKPIKKEL